MRPHRCFAKFVVQPVDMTTSRLASAELLVARAENCNRAQDAGNVEGEMQRRLCFPDTGTAGWLAEGPRAPVQAAGVAGPTQNIT